MKSQTPLASTTRKNPLALDEETMRQLGYQAVDTLVQHYADVRNKPVVSPARAGRCLPESMLGFSPGGKDPCGVLQTTIDSVFEQCMHLIHPRFFAYIPGPSNFVSAIADMLVSGFNIFAGTAPHNLGPYEIECATIRWLCNLAGMNEEAGGLFVSGGSVASLTALAVARQIKLENQIEDTVIYYSSETHSSIDRALFILGFREDQIRELPPDNQLRLAPDQLEAAIKQDRAAGRRPFCLVGNAGTTNTGAVDPLDALADICQRESLWFHVDAAYGGGALLTEQERAQFNGIERADSIALDPHKWLFQPYECGCILVREREWLRTTFRRLPDYMRDTDAGPGMTNYRDMSPQVTRSFKAFKLWLSLQVFGIDAFRQAVERGLELARFTQEYLQKRPAWEVVTPATLGVVTFRYVVDHYTDQELDRINSALIDRVNDDGFAFFSSTLLFGKRVNRICPLHPGLTQDDITQTVERLEAIAEELENNE
ncbi:MAG: pyridoxal phosphate-dependent decarboxylase family protein [Gammaproteobacteria bacterium]